MAKPATKDVLHLTMRSALSPAFVISPIVLSSSYYLFRLFDVGHYSTHYAFLYYLLASPLVLIPFAVSAKEKARFEKLGYVFRSDTRAVAIYVSYGLLASVSWAYISTYWFGHGALAAALNVLIGWAVLIGVNIVPLWLMQGTLGLDSGLHRNASADGHLSKESLGGNAHRKHKLVEAGWDVKYDGNGRR